MEKHQNSGAMTSTPISVYGSCVTSLSMSPRFQCQKSLQFLQTQFTIETDDVMSLLLAFISF